jgi:hypothetical protein
VQAAHAPSTSSMQRSAVLVEISEERERLVGYVGGSGGIRREQSIRVGYKVFFLERWLKQTERLGSLASPWSLRPCLRRRSIMDGGSSFI